MPVAFAFETRLERALNGCLLWTGAKRNWGYGVYHRKAAHRYAYEQAHGTIPDGMLVLHRCDTPACCEVSHLFLGTQTDNMRDMVAKRRHRGVCQTHCAQGHEYDEKNTHRRHGKRTCRACNLQAVKRYQARKGIR